MTDVTFDAREQAIRQHVAAQGFMNLIGAELGKLTRGTCEMSVVKRPELLQQHGMFHGGVTAFLVDNSTTIAASTMIQQGQAVLTAEYKLSLLAPGLGERLVCRARVIKAGKNLSVVAADVFSVTGAEEKHTATALATIAVIASKG
ncbi:MAG: PaaI family thioesterase [Steroidobacteraceae bacterium]|jgi:uncharacterized protein (TIGR00369 family)